MLINRPIETVTIIDKIRVDYLDVRPLDGGVRRAVPGHVDVYGEIYSSDGIRIPISGTMTIAERTDLMELLERVGKRLEAGIRRSLEGTNT